MTDLTDRDACIALNLIPGIGPVRVRRLLDALGGSPSRVLSASRAELRSVAGIGQELASAVANWRATIDLGRELRRISELRLSVLTWSDPNFPPLLRESYDPPIVLYCMGEVLERDRHAVAIVGSRQTTHYGVVAARVFGGQLARAGLTVVSGLARGIDTAAHQGALNAGGRTVAVIGCGLGNIYPPENRELAEMIAGRRAGAVVSEFPIDQPPDKKTFPMRNRIVAGWCQALVVVEAPARSGALITAAQATELGRTVFAVPGPIDRPHSVGSHRLIQQGARLAIGADDVLEDFGELFRGKAGAGAARPSAALDLTVEERAVFDALEMGEAPVDELVARCGLAAPKVSTTLLRLQMKRLVDALPGNYFIRRV